MHFGTDGNALRFGVKRSKFKVTHGEIKYAGNSTLKLEALSK